MQPHQQRVVEEKQQLDDKISKLWSFICSDKFDTIVSDVDERSRLTRQYEVMHQYSGILAERIAAFV